MKIDTFTCDTCKRAIDVPNNPTGITAFPRCIITKNCHGLMGQVSKLFVSSEQYHNSGTSSDSWSQRPMMYNHDQSAARKVWTVNHNLGTQPILNVYVNDFDGNPNRLDTNQYSVQSLSEKTAVIVFSTAQTGTVQCIVRQSASKVAYAASAPISDAQTTRLLYNQTIILATKRSVDSISLVINSSPPKVVTLSTDAASLETTPWAGTKSVRINNELYNVVAINAEGLTAGVGAVASFWFATVGGVAPLRGDTYVLLAKEPYQHKVDKMLSSVLDVAVVSATYQNLTSLVGSTLYCHPRLVASIYPPMELIE